MEYASNWLLLFQHDVTDYRVGDQQERSLREEERRGEMATRRRLFKGGEERRNGDQEENSLRKRLRDQEERTLRRNTKLRERRGGMETRKRAL